jgi:hypothetical protein
MGMRVELAISSKPCQMRPPSSSKYSSSSFGGHHHHLRSHEDNLATNSETVSRRGIRDRRAATVRTIVVGFLIGIMWNHDGCTHFVAAWNYIVPWPVLVPFSRPEYRSCLARILNAPIILESSLCVMV